MSRKKHPRRVLFFCIVLILSVVLAILLLVTVGIYSEDKEKVKKAGAIDVTTERRDVESQIVRMRTYVSSCLAKCKEVAAAKETVVYYEELREELDDCALRLKDKN